jgi:hypothetical protein
MKEKAPEPYPVKRAVVLFSSFIVLFLGLPFGAAYVLISIERSAQQKSAWSNGLFPACADKVKGYYQHKDGSTSVDEVKGNPSSMVKNGDIVTGDINFEYTYSYSGASPEMAAQTYAAGVAIGLDKEEMADSAARSMSSGSLNYERKVKYIYNAKKDSCVLNKNVIDVKTGESLSLSS